MRKAKNITFSQLKQNKLNSEWPKKIKKKRNDNFVRLLLRNMENTKFTLINAYKKEVH